MGKVFKKVARIALPVAGSLLAPGIGTALGSTLSGAALSGIGGALGGGLGGAIGGGGLKGALLGAAMGGAGGYLSNGGLSQISDSLGIGNLNPLASAARTGVSSAATSAPSGSALSGLLPGAGSAGAGGGVAGGFFSGLPSDAISYGSGLGPLPWNAATPALPWAANATSAGESLLSGLTDSFKGSNLVGGGLKAGLSYALSDDNAGGYGAIQNAANTAANSYAPYTQSGAAASKLLADINGLNGPEAQSAALQGFQTDPGYKFALDQGVDALDASAAKRGLLISGNNQQAVQNYGSGLASQYFKDYIGRLSQQAGTGYNATGQQAQNTMDAATAYALMKANKGNQWNQALAGFLG